MVARGRFELPSTGPKPATQGTPSLLVRYIRRSFSSTGLGRFPGYPSKSNIAFCVKTLKNWMWFAFGYAMRVNIELSPQRITPQSFESLFLFAQMLSWRNSVGFLGHLLQFFHLGFFESNIDSVVFSANPRYSGLPNLKHFV